MSKLTPLRIDSIAHGGDGVGVLPSGKKVFVPLVAPGDLLEVEQIEERKQFVRGRVLRVLQPGPDRRPPPCRHASVCGGCQLQQIDDGAQLLLKEQAFYDTLERLGGVARDEVPVADPILPSPKVFRYRIRARLNVRGGALGYLERSSQRLVPIEECLLLETALEALVLAIGERLRQAPIRQLRAIEVSIDEEGRGAAALEPAEDAGPTWSRGVAELLRGIEGLQGVVCLPAAGGRKLGPRHAPTGQPAQVEILGDPILARKMPLEDGVTLATRPDAFAQANAAANEALVRLVVEGLELGQGERVLELYSGAGNFSFPLAARGAEVIAVESVGVSLELAQRTRASLAEAGGEEGPKVRFIGGDAGRVVQDFAREGHSFDRVLLDPPRAGAKGLAKWIASLGASRIAYVSCDPASLARDLVEFREAGYQPLRITPIDMFPQTYHVEAVVLLGRRRGLNRPRGI